MMKMDNENGDDDDNEDDDDEDDVGDDDADATFAILCWACDVMMMRMMMITND